MGIQHSSESIGQYLLRRADLGSLLKSGVLLDPAPFSPGHEFYVSSKSHRKIHLFIPPSFWRPLGVNKKKVCIKIFNDILINGSFINFHLCSR